MRRLRLAGVVGLAAGLCLGWPAAASPGPGRPTQIMACPWTCGEPSVAVDAAGRIFVTDTSNSSIAVSDDGGRTFTHVPAPPAPSKQPALFVSQPAGDAIVQTDGRDIFYSRLLFQQRGVVAAPPNMVPPGIGYAGIQVARSDDGGRRWQSNVTVGFPPGQASTAIGTDRPWLAFGPHHRVYLTWLQVLPSNWLVDWLGAGSLSDGLNNPAVIHLARSDDDGSSFRQLAPIIPPSGEVVTAAGAPVVASDGRLTVPFIASPLTHSQHTDAVEVAQSIDGGKSFGFATVYDTYGSPCLDQTGSTACNDAGWHFPAVALDGSNRMDVAWWRQDGIWSATSSDRGVHWRARRWVTPSPADAGPSIQARAPGRLTMAWYERTKQANQSRFVLSSGPAGGAADSTRAVATVTQSPYSWGGTNTDYASMAALPTGGTVVVWASGPVWFAVVP